MKVEKYQCDVCGGVKGETNKWVRVRDAGKGAFHIYYWDYFSEGGSDSSIPMLHICGAQCLLKKMQAFMDKRT